MSSDCGDARLTPRKGTSCAATAVAPSAGWVRTDTIQPSCRRLNRSSSPPQSSLSRIRVVMAMGCRSQAADRETSNDRGASAGADVAEPWTGIHIEHVRLTRPTMKTALLHEIEGLRTVALVLDTDDEAIARLASFAVDYRLAASHFIAIGAFSRAVVAYFDWPTKQYRHTTVNEQVEVLSLVGDIVIEDDLPKVHAHVVLGKADATAHGGHLIEGHVRPTLEIIVTETPRHLRRRFDPLSKLALIDTTVL